MYKINANKKRVWRGINVVLYYLLGRNYFRYTFRIIIIKSINLKYDNV